MNTTTLNQIAQLEKTRREILNRADLIPPLPDLVVRLLSLLNRPETEPRHLEQTMRSDQVLVGKMLAMANSPFYGLNRTIRTISDAVMVLGFRGVRSIVLASSTAKFLQRDYTCYGHDQKGLWMHSACVAAGARFLARTCRLSAETSERMFIAGLLHDIGKMLLVSYVADGQKLRPQNAPTMVELERRITGLDHTEAGALVLAKWNLGADLQEIVKAHHGDSYPDSPEETAIVRIADATARERGYGYLPKRAPALPVLPEDLDAAGLARDWEQTRGELIVTMEEALNSLAALSS
ncbi:MAG: HDOD domain-containing protein [Planctomycetota bacterium]